MPVTDDIAARVTAGLRSVMAAPVGSGVLDVLGGYSSQEGAFARAQLGYRPSQNLGLFAQADASTRLGLYAGLGLHLDF